VLAYVDKRIVNWVWRRHLICVYSEDLLDTTSTAFKRLQTVTAHGIRYHVEYIRRGSGSREQILGPIKLLDKHTEPLQLRVRPVLLADPPTKFPENAEEDLHSSGDEAAY
jgi:hypothetical protein